MLHSFEQSLDADLDDFFGGWASSRSGEPPGWVELGRPDTLY